MKVIQRDLIMDYFKNNPNRNISHPEIVDWVTIEYEKATGEKFRDPDRAIRKLAQEGQLIKIAKGVYKYDTEFATNKILENFTEQQKKHILERDNFKCVVCGKGIKDGVELHVDHIKPKELGGKATIENAQILCAQHNFQKKTLKQTETGKKMFIRLYELAKSEENNEILEFCINILNVYEEMNINGHIEWKR